MSYLLDTCILSELRKEVPSKVKDWFKSRDEDLFYISVVTVAELWDGIERLPSSSKKSKIEDWFIGEVMTRFKNRILPIDTKVGMEWGSLNSSLRKKGINLGTQDLYIGAIAKANGMSIITINTKDFEPMGVPLYNPWVG